ncbi:uncharacterized protein LY89DRAFT_614606 [Mollisia scopiformis]|uniref:DUF2293 domain-containing protein n=1 Tax=Mollisia scopiformis TaxID=149040 RepID=A0A194XD70_MOLSC|nr:uncharacterized protein LY89DRAFT_614606 [Mollisia scopiformis]KUJ18104.1 hypothetical protein LY89DRAFT_614606 [Mollisia scopiformis]
MGKKKKVIIATKAVKSISKKGGRPTKEERRAHKLERRKKEKKNYTADDWAAPAPSHLVAKLDLPKVKSKYQSYFEFADNPEKKEKRLEFTVTDDARPPPGFVFIPIGDPILTNKCKELSRERDAMIFIVSTWKEENSKISEHVHRTGYHFRETIVEEAREIIGETVISKPTTTPGFIEPIPESQDEINKQADGAIRDLFPRIPNTDRTMIIEHAFKKGAMFHGEPTVGLQSNIPLSRRVQLAVLAHIRHTHTRYDKLLRETSWMNARKAVEPVCLDVLVKWRGDEETGRDQMDEILREVVIITDSEGEDEDESDSSDDDSSDEEGEVTSASSTEAPSLPVSRNQQRSLPPNVQHMPTAGPSTSQVPLRKDGAISSRTRSKADPNAQKDKKAQRGFKRYQAAWDDAIHRRQERPISRPNLASTTFEEPNIRRSQNALASPVHTLSQQPPHQYVATRQPNLTHQYRREDSVHYVQPRNTVRPAPYYSQQGPIQGPSFPRDEVIVRSHTDRPIYYEEVLPRVGTPSRFIREQRPSQVVRGSPLKRGPEDMPLPSIETASSDIPTPHKESQDFYPRRAVEQRLQSPAARQVIVINDDSPPVKRRRMVYEDDSGSFRPVPSRDHGLHVSAPHSASHLISAPSDQSEDFLVRRPAASSYSTQGLVRREPEFYTDPVTAERLPIYDAPAPVYMGSRPEYTRRMEADPIPGRRVEDRSERPTGSQAYRDNIVDGPFTRIPTSMRSGGEGFQEAERDHSRQVQSGYNYGAQAVRPMSPEYRVSQQSRSLNQAHGSNVPDQNFIHSFSQSRLDGQSSQARDGFTIISERPYQNGVDHGNHTRYEQNSARSVMPGTAPRVLSPVRYIERPM